MTGLSPMTGTGEQIRLELEKAASLVTTAHRLLATGTMVDLSALEGKVRIICEALAGMDRADGQTFRPGMESLIADLDRLAQAINDRYDPRTRLGDPAPMGR